MLKISYAKEFFISFGRIEKSLFAYWKDNVYAENLLKEIQGMALLAAETPAAFSRYKGDRRRFLIKFHSIQYIVDYRATKKELRVLWIAYAKSNYAKKYK